MELLTAGCTRPIFAWYAKKYIRRFWLDREMPNRAARGALTSRAQRQITRPSFDHTIQNEVQTVIVRSLPPKEFGVRDDSMVGGVRSQNSRPCFSGPIAVSRMIARKTK